MDVAILRLTYLLLTSTAVIKTCGVNNCSGALEYYILCNVIINIVIYMLLFSPLSCQNAKVIITF